MICYADRMVAPRREFQTAAYFWAKVSVGEPDECWLWTGGVFQRPSAPHQAYGRFNWTKDDCRYAHRVAYQLSRELASPPDESLVVMHLCDVPLCCNPAHLRLGTTQENNADRDSKGRQQHGERHHATKLTEDQVREIRKSPLSLAFLGKRYGITKQSVKAIKDRRTWKHVA